MGKISDKGTFFSDECYYSYISNSRILSLLSDTGLAPDGAEMSRMLFTLTLPLPKNSACRGETRDGVWMLPKFTFIVEAKKFS